MTDRYAGYVVTMEHDQRSDDAEHTINAIRMVRGVIDVKPITADMHLHMAEERVRNKYQIAMWEAVRAVFERTGAGAKG